MTQTLNIDQTKQVLNALNTLSPLNSKPYSGHTVYYDVDDCHHDLNASGSIILWDGEERALELYFKDTNYKVFYNMDCINAILNDIAPNK